jgi:HD-GYP domain-containing protein (c-di-GMP phosphodiesterase class II)
MPFESDLNVSLSLIAELGAELTAAATLPELVATLERRLKWLLPMTSVALCLAEGDAPTYRRVTESGEVAVIAGADPVSWGLRTHTGVHIPDLQTSEGYPPGCLPHGTGSLLTLPLAENPAVVGMLVLQSSRPGAFLKADRGVLHLIALQVTGAVRVALLLDELDGAEAVIASMARAVDAKDSYTAGHSDRVTRYGVDLATAAGLPFAVRGVIARAGPLHDVGKIGVPDVVLRKTDRLNDEEYLVIQQHPVIGDDICRPLNSLQRLRAGVRHHHERYDGLGYPDKLAGLAIPIEARVLAVADAFDAMTSSRPYRSGMPFAKALSILAANEGPQWDPEFIRVFCEMMAVAAAA